MTHWLVVAGRVLLNTQTTAMDKHSKDKCKRNKTPDVELRQGKINNRQGQKKQRQIIKSMEFCGMQTLANSIPNQPK